MNKMIADLHAGKWRVHFVLPGDAYGATGRLTYTEEEAKEYGEGLPMVEFYDASANPAEYPGGQFVSRYYMKTLLGLGKWDSNLKDMADQGIGFSLYGDVPAWTVYGNDLKTIAEGIWNTYHNLA